MIKKKSNSFLSCDRNTSVNVVMWCPDETEYDKPVAVLQICHGMIEHIDMIQKYIESKGMPIENWDITVGYCTNLEEAEKYRDDVEAQLGVKLLERREDFKTRISIISGCHTGPYALGIACIPKYTTIKL